MTKATAILTAVLFLLTPCIAWADDPPAPAPADPVADAEKVIDDAVKAVEGDPAGTIEQMVQLAKEGRWGPLIGLFLTFLVWVCRKYIWKLIPKGVLPWLTLGLAMVVSVAVELLLGVVWWKTLIDGFLACGSAMAFWTLVIKYFLGKKEENEE